MEAEEGEVEEEVESGGEPSSLRPSRPNQIRSWGQNRLWGGVREEVMERGHISCSLGWPLMGWLFLVPFCWSPRKKQRGGNPSLLTNCS